MSPDENISRTITRTVPRVQASEVSFELHSLGWKAFQSLGVAITGEVWGQTIQSFFDSNDGGRDGAFSGVWKPNANEHYEGSFTVQCKFTAKQDSQLQVSDVTEELVKANKLASKGLANNYFLLTNTRLKGSTEAYLKVAFESIPGISNFAAYGVERLSQIIRESPRLRMLVPRIYGLGDLSQILDERACAQADEILSALGDDLAKFVITDAYRQSARALVDHGFVLLLGEAACGKSTIAAALAVGALDEWGCSTIKIRNADDFVKHSNPHEPKQFFWVDDAFGATQFEWETAAEWNRVLPHIHAAIRRGARVLFTSRDYIYRSARNFLKESAFPLMRESQVVIHVDQLNKDEREQILYNHIRLGTQSQAVKLQLKPYLKDFAAHPRFSPEIARRLGNPLFTRELLICRSALDTFVEHPVPLLCDIIRTIDSGSRSALALVFIRGGTLPSPITMTPEEEKAIALLGGSVATVRTAFNSLEGSLLLSALQSGQNVWKFKHPTIRDAFAAVISDDRELMDIYLAGAPVEKLFNEVSCGDIGIEGVKVKVPQDRYDALIARIDVFTGNASANSRVLHSFLAIRCDKPFLLSYIATHPDFISKLTIGSYFYAWSDIGVIARLNQHGLLSELQRKHFADVIQELAIETPDSGFLSDRVREILTPHEIALILNRIRTELLPKIDNIIETWKRNHNGKDNPESHFEELVSALTDFDGEFQDYPDARSQIENAKWKIKGVIEELNSEQSQEPDSDDYVGKGVSNNEGMLDRSIFDDVDL